MKTHVLYIVVAYRGRTMCRHLVFANFLDGVSIIWIKNGRYAVFQTSDGDSKIQFLIKILGDGIYTKN